MSRSDRLPDGYSDEFDPVEGCRKLVAPHLRTILEAESEEDAIRKLNEFFGPVLLNSGLSRVPGLWETLVQYVRAEYAGDVPEEGHVYLVSNDNNEEDGDYEDGDGDGDGDDGAE